MKSKQLVALFNDSERQVNILTKPISDNVAYIYSDALTLEVNLKDNTLNTLENYLNALEYVDKVIIYNIDKLCKYILGVVLGTCRAKGIEVIADSDRHEVRRLLT